MTPGRKIQPEDLLKIIWGRRWLLVLPLIVGGIGTAVYARRLPNIYESSTVIQVIPQGIPESFVRSTVTTQLSQRLTTISQLILSRSRIENLIVELNLYQNTRQTGTMQDAVERMQRDIRGPTLTTAQRAGAARQRSGSSGSFVLGFLSGDPQTALKVTERLASMFIEENLRQRTGQAESTDRFLESQLESARVVLVQHESRLADFNRRFNASLPKQLGANQSGLQATQNQINALVEKTVLERERRLMLERQITDLESLDLVESTARQTTNRALQRSPSAAASSRSTGGGAGTRQAAAGPSRQGGGNERGGAGQPRSAGAAQGPLAEADIDAPASVRVERARTALQALELRLTQEHPDVKIARRRIAELEKLAEEEALQAPLAGATGLTGLSAAELQKQQQLHALRDEMARVDRQIERREAEEKALREKLATYQQRIEQTPALEAQLTALTRDYDTYQAQYDSLLRKKTEAKIATDLEQRQIAEQFRVVEPPRLPQRPSSPDRPRLIMLGSVSGLALGLLLAALLEYRDRTFKTEGDVVAALSIPVLAIVPTIVTAADYAKRVRQRLLLTGSLATLVIITVAAWKLQVLDGWLL